jgi:hypothetical protein
MHTALYERRDIRTCVQAVQLTALGGEGCGSGCEGGREPGVGILERCATGVRACLGDACRDDAGIAIPWCVELEYVCLWKLGSAAPSRNAAAFEVLLSALASKLRLAVCRDFVLLGFAMPEARCPGVLLTAAGLLGLGLLLMPAGASGLADNAALNKATVAIRGVSCAYAFQGSIPLPLWRHVSHGRVLQLHSRQQCTVIDGSLTEHDRTHRHTERLRTQMKHYSYCLRGDRALLPVCLEMIDRCCLHQSLT